MTEAEFYGVPIVLTTLPVVPQELLPQLPKVTYVYGEHRVTFIFDDETLAQELAELFYSVNAGKEPKKVEEQFKYSEILEFNTTPEFADYIIIGEVKPPYYCVEFLPTVVVKGKTMKFKFYFCFSDKSFANWLASIVEKVYKKRHDLI